MDDVARARGRAAALVADLGAELAGLAEATASGPDDEHDAEGATIGFERARVQALLAAAAADLAALEDVVARTGTYDPDRCADCGGPIGAERLSALPATRRCVRCAGTAASGARAARGRSGGAPCQTRR